MKKIIWITGGGTGLGLATAKKFSEEGWSVAISGRNKARLTAAANEIGSDALPVECDVADESSVRDAYEAVSSSLGVPDVLVSNAGIGELNSFESIPPAEFKDTLNTNVFGSFLTIQSVLPDMLTRGSGTIVQMLSIASTKVFAGGASYGASKFGALGMIGSLREDVRSKGIRVIGVMPGAADTDIWTEGTREEFGYRMMKPSTIAYVVYHAVMTPDDAMVEEIVIRPQLGDLDSI